MEKSEAWKHNEKAIKRAFVREGKTETEAQRFCDLIMPLWLAAQPKPFTAELKMRKMPDGFLLIKESDFDEWENELRQSNALHLNKMTNELVDRLIGLYMNNLLSLPH
ncbi:MAG: hypothetical protein MI796_12875 [Enterobacterales bacterium]|nr:hypothetical protein [Enterobacterales bacterium]